MKKPLIHLSPKAAQIAHYLLYIVLLVFLLGALFTAKELPEIIGFAALSLYCLYAMIKDTRKSNFETLNTFVLEKCEPQNALKYLTQYPYLLRSGSFSASAKLLKAYALIDSGAYEEALRYITEDEKGAFSTSYTKAIADYLVFNVAFLRKLKGEVKDTFATLTERKSSFFVDKETEQPGHLWYMAQGNYNIIMKEFAQAHELFEKVDLEQLKYNRDKAYYYYSRALICSGMGDEEGHERYKQQALGLAANFDAVKALYGTSP